MRIELNKLEWKPGHNSSFHLHIGAWQVGQCYYSGSTSKDNPKKWVVKTYLPGLKADQGHFSTDAEAKVRLIQVTKHWFEKLG